MGILLIVGEGVMYPVNGYPLGRGILQVTLGEQDEPMLEPLGHDQAAVGQQSVISQRDPEAIELDAEDRQRQSGPAKHPGDKRGQSRHMDGQDRDEVEPDRPVETDRGRSRQVTQTLRVLRRRQGRIAYPNIPQWRIGVDHGRSIPSIEDSLFFLWLSPVTRPESASNRGGRLDLTPVAARLQPGSVGPSMNDETRAHCLCPRGGLRSPRPWP